MAESRTRVTGRYAPSPTGAMHLGNARTALLAWLHSRARGGRHLLRFEDLDAGRVREWAYDLTRRDLLWLGLDWDAEVIQSARLDLYAGALSRLETYHCRCTRRQIAEAVSAPHGAEAVYPGTCRPDRTPKAGLPATQPPQTQPPPTQLLHNRASAVRWRAPQGTVCAVDSRLATLCQSLEGEIGDFVLRRGDGAYAYHLAVVVDDAEQEVTDVVRGEDLWTSTPRHVALQRALGYTTPRYLHVPLMSDFRGERLAKRAGAASVASLREAGERPAQVLSALARSLGWVVPEEVSLDTLLVLYTQNLDRLSKNEDPFSGLRR